MKLSNDTVLSRFLRYVVVDTQSDPTSAAQPSTEKQKDLARILVAELLDLGLADAHMDEHGNVYATLPSNTEKDVPVICFCSHVDTAPDFTGTSVRPQVVRNYEGGDIVLPGDSDRVIRPSEHPELLNLIGNEIVTSDGTTLLGADDKAGVAEIMTAAAWFMAHPEVKHGTVKILFTTDEEIGRGADKVNLEKLGARFAYTMDGSTAGDIETRPSPPMASRSRFRASPCIRASPRTAWKMPSRSPPRSWPACRNRSRPSAPKAVRALSIRFRWKDLWKRQPSASSSVTSSMKG